MRKLQKSLVEVTKSFKSLKEVMKVQAVAFGSFGDIFKRLENNVPSHIPDIQVDRYIKEKYARTKL